MASSSSHNNNSGIPLATLLEWYKIRDMFFGVRFLPRNIPLALEMASSCAHPDARWLTEVCAGKNVKTIQQAKRVFSALGQNDARALCYMWRCGVSMNAQDFAALHRSAELGFAYAQSLIAGRTRNDVERFKLAQLAAAQGERDACYMVGVCFRHGDGCEKDLNKAKENFLFASELGDVQAMCFLGDMLDDLDPQRWQWWGRAAALGNAWNFLHEFARQVALFNSGSGSAAVVFAIGRALNGHVDEQARTILSEIFMFDSRIGPAKQAIAFYHLQIEATKDAIKTWTLVGIHFNVVKDVRKLISKLIWDSREQALYKT
jgi:TPR repeat protein